MVPLVISAIKSFNNKDKKEDKQISKAVDTTTNISISNKAPSTALVPTKTTTQKKENKKSKEEFISNSLSKVLATDSKMSASPTAGKQAQIQKQKHDKIIEESLKDIILSKVRLIQDVAIEIEDLLDQNH